VALISYLWLFPPLMDITDLSVTWCYVALISHRQSHNSPRCTARQELCKGSPVSLFDESLALWYGRYHIPRGLYSANLVQPTQWSRLAFAVKSTREGGTNATLYVNGTVALEIAPSPKSKRSCSTTGPSKAHSAGPSLFCSLPMQPTGGGTRQYQRPSVLDYCPS
jgi:hypothetical protein